MLQYRPTWLTFVADRFYFQFDLRWQMAFWVVPWLAGNTNSKMRFHAPSRLHQAEVDRIEYIRLLKYNHAIYTLPRTCPGSTAGWVRKNMSGRDVKVTSPQTPPTPAVLFSGRVAYQMIAIDTERRRGRREDGRRRPFPSPSPVVEVEQWHPKLFKWCNDAILILMIVRRRQPGERTWKCQRVNLAYLICIPLPRVCALRCLLLSDCNTTTFNQMVSVILLKVHWNNRFGALSPHAREAAVLSHSDTQRPKMCVAILQTWCDLGL